MLSHPSSTSMVGQKFPTPNSAPTPPTPPPPPPPPPLCCRTGQRRRTSIKFPYFQCQSGSGQSTARAVGGWLAVAVAAHSKSNGNGIRNRSLFSPPSKLRNWVIKFTLFCKSDRSKSAISWLPMRCILLARVFLHSATMLRPETGEQEGNVLMYWQ